MEEKIYQAVAEGVLQIGDIEIPVAVLDDGTRVITRKGFLTALGRPWKGSSRTELPIFVGAVNLKPFVSNELYDGLIPLKYKSLQGALVDGYKALILPMICDTYLAAREADVLTKTQQPAAKQAEILIRSLAKVGIIALIDEATGYQEIRTKRALADILEKFIAQELRPWVKTFPDEYYQELFRLRGWYYDSASVKRPPLIGKITNEIIYKRLAPGVLDELKKVTPVDDKGRRKHRYFQRLTENIGYKKLQETLSNVIVLMRAASNYRKFESMINRAMPKYGHSYEIPLDYREEDEDE
jgi:hypothetical protein